MLVIDNDAVRSLLRMPDVIDRLETAYAELVDGTGVCRPRIDVRMPVPDSDAAHQWGTTEGGSLATGYFALRVKSDIVYEVDHPDGRRTQEKHCGQPGTYCGFVLLFSARTGLPLALVNDGLLQQMRVGADAAIGAKHAARPGPWTVGMLGSGGQARSHIAAFAAVRDLARVKVYSPTPANRERFAAEIRDAHGVDVDVCTDPDEVYRDVDVLAACTDVAGELVEGAKLQPGTHVTAAGGRPDAAARDRFDVWFRLGQVSTPINKPDWQLDHEFLVYAAVPDSPAWGSHTRHRQFRPSPQPTPTRRVVTLADALGGDPVRRDTEEITYSERGNVHGAQFHAVAGHLYELATAAGVGTQLPTELFLQDIRN